MKVAGIDVMADPVAARRILAVVPQRNNLDRSLLRISHGVAAPGAKTEVHTHPGTEAFFVLKGQLSQKTPHGVNVVEAGKTLAGGPAEHPMEITSSGGGELHWLIMFVVDANRPFSVGRS